jgi:hypothetical protein
VKTAKLLDKLGTLLHRAPDLDADRLQKLRKVVKELKQKEKRLAKERRREKDPEERHRLKMAEKVVHAQRKKGVEVYKSIKRRQSDGKDA